jgi:hypothetical protein
MVLLDEEGQLEPVIVPIDDVPLRPDSMEAGLAEVITGLRDLGDPALLLSRPGPGGMTEEDRQWGRMLAPLTRWAVHLYTPSGLQVFAPDDLVRTGNVVTPGSPVGSGRAPADTDRRSEKDRTVP